MTQHADRNGRATDYQFDALGRPLEEYWYNSVADADQEKEKGSGLINWPAIGSPHLLLAAFPL